VGLYLALALLLPTAAAGAAGSAQLDESIRRGLDYLYSVQQKDGSWPSRSAAQHPGGLEALVVLAAVTAGEDLNEEPLQAALKRLDQTNPQTVYARAFRAMAYSRIGTEAYVSKATEDIRWLQQNIQTNGGWGYGPGHPTTVHRRAWVDNSNTYMALLALHEAAGAGVLVTAPTWRRARLYWSRGQNEDGGWGYSPPTTTGVRLRAGSYGAMTAAGWLTELNVLSRLLESDAPPAGTPRQPQSLPEADTQAARAAEDWLRKNYSVDKIPGWGWGTSDYWLHLYQWSLLRAVNAAGLRTLGKHDVRAEVADRILRLQLRDGSWGDGVSGRGDPVRTCFAILAMSEARRLTLVNRLSTDGAFGADCRDMAHFTRWLSRDLHGAVTWQHLDPEQPHVDRVLAEAPILYIVGQGKFALPREIDRRIRSFVTDGGTVVVQALGGDKQYADSARAYFLSRLQHYRPRELTGEDLLFTAKDPVKPRGGIVGIGDVCRTPVYIFTADLSGPLHHNRLADAPDAFYLFGNLAQAALADQGRLCRFAPLGGHYRGPRPLRTVPVARVAVGENWSACAAAIGRLSHVLSAAVSMGVQPAEAVDLTRPVPENIPLLWWTGHGAVELSPAQKKNLKTYLDGGGTLFADAVTGDRAFTDSVRGILQELFGEPAVSPLPPGAPLLTGRFGGGVGADVSKIRYEGPAAENLPGEQSPLLWAVTRGERVAAVLSPYGVTSPLAGAVPANCLALARDDARRLACNVVLYALSEDRQLLGTPAPRRRLTDAPKPSAAPTPKTAAPPKPAAHPKAPPTDDGKKTIFDF